MIFLLDTNVVSDLIVDFQPTTLAFYAALQDEHRCLVSQPVHYEIKRGLLYRGNVRKLDIYQNKIIPLVETINVEAEDWNSAAQLWADAVTKGKQLSDIDLLLAALAQRLNATISTSDDDFDAFPVQRTDWRIS
jgi:predicted nucleic acid-binding protein